MTESTITNADHLPRYRCHKVVRAAPVLAINAHLNGWHVTVATGEGGPTKPLTLLVPADTFHRGRPQPQDYLVIYENEDGSHYVSWSPRLTFDRGYQREDAST